MQNCVVPDGWNAEKERHSATAPIEFEKGGDCLRSMVFDFPAKTQKQGKKSIHISIRQLFSSTFTPQLHLKEEENLLATNFFIHNRQTNNAVQLVHFAADTSTVLFHTCFAHSTALYITMPYHCVPFIDKTLPSS